MGEFNSDDNYIYCWGQESLRRNGVAIMVNKRIWNVVLGCNLKNDRMISVRFQGKPFNIQLFYLFILFMGFSRQEYWSGLPFPSPVDHILSHLSTMTRPTWVALQAWLSFIELDKAVVLVWLDWLVFFEYDFSVSALWCSLATPTIWLGLLLPWTWGIPSQLLHVQGQEGQRWGDTPRPR